MTQIPLLRSMIVVSRSVKHIILIINLIQQCVLLYRTQFDDGGEELWSIRRQRPLPARLAVVVPSNAGGPWNFDQGALQIDCSHLILAVVQDHYQDPARISL